MVPDLFHFPLPSLFSSCHKTRALTTPPHNAETRGHDHTASPRVWKKFSTSVNTYVSEDQRQRMTTRRAPQRKHALSAEDEVLSSSHNKKPKAAAVTTSRRRAAKPALPATTTTTETVLPLDALLAVSASAAAAAAVPAEGREHFLVGGATGPLDPAVPRPLTLTGTTAATTFFPAGLAPKAHSQTHTHKERESRSRTSSGDSTVCSADDCLAFPFSAHTGTHAHAQSFTHTHYDAAVSLGTHAHAHIHAALAAATSAAQEEKALAARLIAKEKNREHAKNTRRRKKQFIEALQQSIIELKAEKERTEKDKKIVAIKQAEQMELRKRVVQDVLSFRAQGVMDRALWMTLLDETVELTLPITPYRSFPPFQVSDGQRHVKGIDAVMLDSASLHAFFQSIVPQLENDNESENPQKKLQVYCQCASNEAVFNEHTLCCAFSLRTYNAVRLGARRELFISGLLRATFSAHHKLTALVLSFDVLALLQLLRNPVAPNTRELALDDALCVQKEGRLIVDCGSGEPIIVNANEIWLQSFSFDLDSVVGRSLFDVVLSRIVEREKAAEFSEYLSHGLPFCTVITLCVCEHEQIYISVWLKLFPLYVTTQDAHRSLSLSQSLLVMERLSCERERASPAVGITDASIACDTSVNQSLSSRTQSSLPAPPAVPVVCDRNETEPLFLSLSEQLDKAYQRSCSDVGERCDEDVSPTAACVPAAPSAVVGAHTQMSSNGPAQPSQPSLSLAAPRTSSISQAFRNAQAQRQQQKDHTAHTVSARTLTQSSPGALVPQSEMAGGLCESTSTRSFDAQFAEFLRDCVDSSHSECSQRDVEREERTEREELCEAMLNMESDKICDYNCKL